MYRLTRLTTAAALLLGPLPATAQGSYRPGYSQGTQISCESRNYRYNRCPVETGGQVQLVGQSGGRCVEGQSWGYDRNSVWVDNGCRAQFIVGGGGEYPGYPGGGGGYYPPPGGGGNWGRGYAGQIRCESWQYQYQRCPAPTNGRVDLIQPIAGTCQQGQSWGYDRDSIWVNNGCRAQFGFGYGQNNNGGGNDTGKAVAGVALAAGLVALLAAAANSNRNSNGRQPAPVINPGAPPARINADLSRLPVSQRAAVQTCLYEAARQLGATGASEVALERLPNVRAVSGGWQVRGPLVASYPQSVRSAGIDCRANGQRLDGFDFTG